MSILFVFQLGRLYGILLIMVCIVRTMKFLKDIIKNKENTLYYAHLFEVALIVGLVAYGGMLQVKHFSVDSPNVWSNMAATWHLQLGRYTNFAIILIAEMLRINAVTSQQIFFFLWIVTMVFMHLMIIASISECLKFVSKKQNLLVLLLVMLSMVNVFSMELMLFPETAMWLSFGNLALGLSIKDSIDSDGSIKAWAIATTELFIAMGCYQSYIGIYEVFVIMGFFLKYHSEKKVRYRQGAIALIIGGGLCLLNVLIVRILIKFSVFPDAGRESGLKNIFFNIKTICRYQLNFWRDADKIFPPVIMPICLIVLLSIFVTILGKQKMLEQKIYITCMICGGYLLAFAPHLLETSISLTPRSNLAIWSVIAVVLILGIYYEEEEQKYYTLVVNLFVVIFTVITISTMGTMIANETATNAIDFSEARAIANKIKKYEYETGNYITKIGTIEDANYTLYSTETKWKNNQLGARIMATPYSNYLLVSYVMQRKLDYIDVPDSIYQEYFKDIDWHNMNVSEQVICVDDNVYLCIY